MKLSQYLTLCTACLFMALSVNGQVGSYNEPYRPQFHFSPKAHWMNDPNGMVYYKGVYHLFYQYYPDGTVWGPMHWGHAESTDLIHWKELPIALYPDKLGYIFSGSAVVDVNNTSGLSKNNKIPLVAMFTHHDPVGEKAGHNNYQNQSLAFSLDDGATWTKYSGNPVLKNPGIKDFRDPKLMWYAKEKKWILTLAVKGHIAFYSATDLKNWKKESEFGLNIGAHGGVWECPDLFPLMLNGKTYWVLLVNLNPGGPNGGSGTQYFIGNFDGKRFTPADTKTRWADYGPDDYAGVTWSNTANRKIFLGWMSNWDYANKVPTVKWRNAMTIPRDLKLKQSSSGIILTSEPVKELSNILATTKVLTNLNAAKTVELSTNVKTLNSQYKLQLDVAQLKSYTITLANSKNEELVIGFDQKQNKYYIDRRKAGQVNFEKSFAGISFAPRFTNTQKSTITLIVDKSSVEVFADDGLTVMTVIYFPSGDLNELKIHSVDDMPISKISVQGIRSIWK